MKSLFRKTKIFFKSIKFSGLSKLLGALAAIVGGIFKITDTNKEAINLHDIYDNELTSTVIILISISLIALGLLAEKGALKERFEGRQVKDILPYVEENGSFISEIPKDVEEIWLCGITFMGTLAANRDQVNDLISKRNVKIKVLLAPKSGPAYDQIMNYFPTKLSGDDLLNRLNFSHKELKKLSQKYTNIQVKTYKTFPCHKLLIFDPDDNYGLQIQPCVYDVDPKVTPLIKLINNEHKEYFKTYKKAFQELWLASDDL